MSDIPEQSTSARPKKEGPRNVSKRGRRVLSLILAVLVLLLIAVSFLLWKLISPPGAPSRASENKGIEWVRSIYGWGPAKNQQLAGPASAAVSPDGTIWVTDPNNARVVAFNPDGSYKSVLKGTADDPFVLPTDVTTDEQGRIYVLESTQDKLHVMTAGDQEILLKRVQGPTAVGVSADRIIVGSPAGFAILDKEGNPIKIVGTQGTGPDQFDTVNSIIVDTDGSFFVLDTFNNRLSKWSPDGTRLWIKSLGKPANNAAANAPSTVTSASTNAMQIPSGMVWDNSRRIVMVDPFSFALFVVNPEDGSVVSQYGGYGALDGQFSYPAAIGYDSVRDWFTVADTGNNRVQIVRLPGSGSSLATRARSSLSGPLRACLFPLALILIAIVVALVSRRRKKGREAASEPEGSVPAHDVDELSTEDEESL